MTASTELARFDEATFSATFSEKIKLAHGPDGFSARAKKTPALLNSYNFRELDGITIQRMFKTLEGDDDACATLALMVAFIYDLTPPR